MSRPIDQPLAIGRERRPEGAAPAVGPARDLSSLTVVDPQLVEVHAVVIQTARRLTTAEPNEALIRTESGSHSPQRRGFTHQLHPSTARPVPHVQLGPIGRHHILTVRRPLRAQVAVVLSLRKLHRIREICRDDPKVLPTVTVRRVDDSFSVRAEPRLGVESHSAGQARRSPTGHRHRKHVSEVVQQNGPAIRADIKRHPRPLGGRVLKPASDLKGKLLLVRVLRRGRVYRRGRVCGLRDKGYRRAKEVNG